MKYLVFLFVFFTASTCFSQEKLLITVFQKQSEMIEMKEQNLLTEWLTEIALKKQSKYHVITKDEVLVLANTRDLKDYLGDCAVTTARKVQAHKVISGDVYKYKKKFRLFMKLHDTRTGHLENSIEISSSKLEKMKGLMGDKFLSLLEADKKQVKREIIKAIAEKKIDRPILHKRASVKVEKRNPPSSPIIMGLSLPSHLKKRLGRKKEHKNDSDPQTLRRHSPSYTKYALDEDIEGYVIIRVKVDAQGDVVTAKAIKKLGYGLTEQALKSAKKWKFFPAQREGKSVEGFKNIKFLFMIND